MLIVLMISSVILILSTPVDRHEYVSENRSMQNVSTQEHIILNQTYNESNVTTVNNASVQRQYVGDIDIMSDVDNKYVMEHRRPN